MTSACTTDLLTDNVCSLQDIFCHVKQLIELKKEVDALRHENRALTKLLATKCAEFEMYGQDVVNAGHLTLGHEPYVCEVCLRVHPGDEVATIPRISGIEQTMRGARQLDGLPNIALHEDRPTIRVCEGCHTEMTLIKT